MTEIDFQEVAWEDLDELDWSGSWHGQVAGGIFWLAVDLLASEGPCCAELN